MPHKPERPYSIELRFYRFAMVSLMSGLTAIAGYIAVTTVNTAAELPAIKQELIALNNNLDKLEELPLQVQSNKDEISGLDRRMAWLEKGK